MNYAALENRVERAKMQTIHFGEYSLYNWHTKPAWWTIRGPNGSFDVRGTITAVDKVKKEYPVFYDWLAEQF
ncbi:hypothetical protein KSX_26990 [Ktedonospora formicarum]|uniref:Uncharacterized protein n=1 Tax=Ktedonospora formicarum TaxID=2778364 RepID=A0A8J3HYX5_9CHLR|nr:hypothetical protein KSX_26990 [Ktedonospora formicarum]